MAVFGPNLKTLTTVYLPPLPRRMETTNRTLVPFPAYYSMTDYDRTGLSQPGSFQKMHVFPADGEYLIRIAGAGFRPIGSEPGQMTFWLDGKLVKTFQVDVDVEQSGFERRPDHWDVRMKITAGPHELVAAFPNQFDGLPALFRGPNPSQRAFDPCRLGPVGGPAVFGGGAQGIWMTRMMETRTRPPGENCQEERAQSKARKSAASAPRRSMAFPCTKSILPDPMNLSRGLRPRACGRFTPVVISMAITCRRANARSSPIWRTGHSGVLSVRQKVDRLVAISIGAQKRGGSFEEGISLAIAAMLASPNFYSGSRISALARSVGRPVRAGVEVYRIFCGAACRTRNY